MFLDKEGVASQNRLSFRSKLLLLRRRSGIIFKDNLARWANRICLRQPHISPCWRLRLSKCESVILFDTQFFTYVLQTFRTEEFRSNILGPHCIYNDGTTQTNVERF